MCLGHLGKHNCFHLHPQLVADFSVFSLFFVFIFGVTLGVVSGKAAQRLTYDCDFFILLIPDMFPSQ
jgi:hypothetical protein